MTEHLKLTYLELPAKDISATKAFFQSVFNWTFKDYGPEYSSFSSESLDGGFFKSDLASSSANGAALPVFYSKTLEDTQRAIEKAGGATVKPIFSFPGGRRFHFVEPSGNEFAVWSDS